MRKLRRAQPRLESLEDKALLSQISLLRVPVRPGAAFVARRPGQVAIVGSSIQGRVTGDYTAVPNPSRAAATYVLSGTGGLTQVGDATVQAVITVNQFRGRTVQTGFITLSGASGTMRLRVLNNPGSPTLKAAGVSGLAETPSSEATLKYSVAFGTGIFRNARGTGLVNISLAPKQAEAPPTDDGSEKTPVGESPGPNNGSTGAGNNGGGIFTPVPAPSDPKGGSTLPTTPSTPRSGVGNGGIGNNVGARAVMPRAIGDTTISSGHFVMVFNWQQNIL